MFTIRMVKEIPADLGVFLAGAGAKSGGRRDSASPKGHHESGRCHIGFLNVSFACSPVGLALRSVHAEIPGKRCIV